MTRALRFSMPALLALALAAFAAAPPAAPKQPAGNDQLDFVFFASDR